MDCTLTAASVSQAGEYTAHSSISADSTDDPSTEYFGRTTLITGVVSELLPTVSHGAEQA